MRIVLDTNVLINGVQDEMSYTNRIIDLCLSGEIQPVISSAILREHQRLADRLITDEEYFDRLDEYYESAEHIEPRSKVRVVENDPEDDKFLACAKDGRADFIISDDRHLLDVGMFKGTKILTPQEFFAFYESEIKEGGGREWSEWVKNIGIGV